MRTVRHDGDGGFTLLEILVVMLIIGVLAAIALPTFLGQRGKSEDASAKADARNLVSKVEACYAETDDYAQCTGTALGATGMSIGSAPGQVEVTSAGTKDYTVTAYSKAGGTFSIVRDGASGKSSRTCTGGGCKGGSW